MHHHHTFYKNIAYIKPTTKTMMKKTILITTKLAATFVMSSSLLTNYNCKNRQKFLQLHLQPFMFDLHSQLLSNIPPVAKYAELNYISVIAPVSFLLTVFFSALNIMKDSFDEKGNYDTRKDNSPADFSFVTDDSFRQEKIEASYAPKYLVGGILAGLTMLPTELSLREESGNKRRVQYKQFRRLSPNWNTISGETGFNLSALNESAHCNTSISRPPFESIQVANIIRTVEFLDDVSKNAYMGSFRIYKMKVSSHILQTLNPALVNDSLNRQLYNSGLDVSNAGGYHSFTTYFEDNTSPTNVSNFGTSSTTLSRRLGEIASEAVEIAEADDFAQSQWIFTLQSNIATNGQNRRRKLQPANISEAWININRHGHWNRLHTHQGSSWSGIYYAQCPAPFDILLEKKQTYEKNAILYDADLLAGESSQVSAAPYSGRLLIKPSPHISENNYELSKLEIARLNCFNPKSCSENQKKVMGMTDPPPTFSCCDYLEIEPEVGMLIVMPGWLQHAVCPLNILKPHRETTQGTRISLAFNFVGI